MMYASNYYSGTFRLQSNYEMELVMDELRIFSQLSLYRNQGFAGQWDEVAQLVMPSHRNTFMFGNVNTPGSKMTDRQVDATGQMALTRFAAICDSLLTPRNMIYQHLAASDEYIMKDRETRLWFEDATKLLFKLRYAPEANFSASNQANFQSLGAFGNMAMFTDKNAFYSGFRYKAVPLGEIFFRENFQGGVDGFTRWFRQTARQAEQMWPGQLPPALQTALIADSEQLFSFLHCVTPRKDYDRERLDSKGKKWRSVYISLEGKCVMHKADEEMEGGYHSFPLAVGRYDQSPNEVYGRGPAMTVLPALKTLNAEKRAYLQQAHRALAPVLLTADDGVVGMSMRPNAVNVGGVNSQGQALVHVLPTGEIQVGKEMMAEERQLINDAFLVTLFQILVKSPQMSATEVIERANEKGILLAPTMGRQQGEYVGAFTVRELDLMMQMRLLRQMPPRLREAGAELHIIYDNPLSRLAKAQEGAGFMRTLESVKELVNITGDASLLDPFDFDVAIPALADQNAVPESWMADEMKIGKKRQARQKAMQAEQQMKNLPNQAAMIKAQAVAAKAGQPQQGGQPAQPGQQ